MRMAAPLVNGWNISPTEAFFGFEFFQDVGPPGSAPTMACTLVITTDHLRELHRQLGEHLAHLEKPPERMDA